MPNKDKTFMVEDAQIVFRNFAGKADKYNREGDRNFSVIIPPDDAEKLMADGWNVRVREPRDEGDEPIYMIQVSVSYKVKPPRITLITSSKRTFVTEDIVDIIDQLDIEKVDLIASGYEWEVNGKTGVKAYLKTMYLTIDEDPLQAKYGFGDVAPKEDADD